MPTIEQLNYRPCDLSKNPDEISHLERVRRIGVWQYENVADSSTLRRFLAGQRDAYPEHISSEVDRLTEENNKFRDTLKSTEIQKGREVIRTRYLQAETDLKDPTYLQIAAARIASSQGIEVKSDFDNTFTNESYATRIKGIKPGHPGAIIADPVLAEYSTEKGFAQAYTELYPASFQQIAQEFPDAFFRSGQHAPIRDGADNMLAYFKEADIPLTFISANLSYTVWGALSGFKHKGEVDVIAMEPDSVRAVHKDAVIVHEALKRPNKATIYIGDGESDKPALEVSDVIAAYFALEGSVFAKQLQEAGLVHFTYNSLNDIVATLEEIKKHNSNTSEFSKNPLPVMISDLARSEAAVS